MANLEILALDTAVPQIRAPGAGDGYSVPRDMTMASGTTLAAQAVTSTSLGTTGNLTFSGTAQRITGDMSNATVSNRLAFQSTGANTTDVGAIAPSGGSAASFIAFNTTDASNASFAQLRIDSVDARFASSKTGTGTFLPMTFYTGGGEKMRLDTSGNLGIGTASPSAKLHSFTSSAAQINNLIQNSVSYLNYGVFGDGNNYLYSGTANNLLLGTNNTERMRIDSSGNVGIGFDNTGTYGKLGVSGTGYQAAVVASSDASGVITVLAANAASEARLNVVSNHPLAIYTNNTERMRIDSSGNVGIGGTAGAASKLHLLGTLPTGSSTTYTVQNTGTFPSGSTVEASSFFSNPTTQATSYTLGSLAHFIATQQAFGAGSTVTNQYGFFASNALTGATNNYGFYSNIASGSNRWNFYAAGTADNYFGGNVGIADTGLTNVRLRVKGSGTGAADYTIYCENSAATPLLYVQNDGKLSTGTAANSPYNLTTGSAANVFVDSSGFLYRSTSSLRYKTDVVNATHGLADVLKLRSVTYKGKNDGDTVFGGLIAEEVHDAGLTEFVAYDKEGRPDALHYGNMVALLVKAVQELSAKVVALEAR